MHQIALVKNCKLVRKMREYISLDVKLGPEINYLKKCYNRCIREPNDSYDLISNIILLYAAIERILSKIISIMAVQDNWEIQNESFFEKLDTVIDYVRGKGISLIIDRDVLSRLSLLRSKIHHGCFVPRYNRDLTDVVKSCYQEVMKIVEIIGKIL